MDKYAFFLFTTNFMPERAFLLLMEETSSILFIIEQECMCVGFEPLMRSQEFIQTKKMKEKQIFCVVIYVIT